MITNNNIAEKEVFSNLQTSHKFGISKQGQSFIIDALSNTIYKNPIGTIVREYVSNAHDANVEAGSKQPVIVSLDRDSNGDYFSVVDMGTGLSEERITSVFVNYGESTKRNNNNEIGGFGIGAKSAFSYSDTFFVNTVVDNFVYKYILMKTNSEPEMQLVSKLENTENLPNGSEIRIYIKSIDRSRFSEEIFNQLRYFDEVFVKDNSSFNDYKIKEFNTFKYSTQKRLTSKFDKLHICLGKVSYPIDFNLLNISSINIPVALKFDIGDLKVTLSREELQYDSVTKEKIKEKIAQFKEEIISLYSSQKFEFIKFDEFLNYSQNNPSLLIPEEGIKFKIDDVVNNRVKKPIKLKQFPWLNSNTFPLSDHNFFLRNTDKISDSGNFLTIKHNKYVTNDLDFGTYVYLPKNFVKNKLVNSYLHSIGVTNVITDVYVSYSQYKRNLHLPNSNKGITSNMNNVKRIKLYKNFMLNELLKKVLDYSKVVVPQSYKDELEQQRKRRAALAKSIRDSKPKVSLSGIEVYDLSQRAGKGFVKTYKDFTKRKYTLVIGRKEQSQEMSDFYRSHSQYNTKYVYHCVTNNKQYDELLKLKNVLPFDGFDKKFKLMSSKKKGYIQYILSCDEDIQSVSESLISLDKKKDSIWKNGFVVSSRDIEWIEKNMSFDLKNTLSEESFFLRKKAKRLNSLIPYNRKFIDNFHLYNFEMIFDVTKQVGSDVKKVRKFLTKHGYFPGRNSYCPIDKWEVDFIKENEEKLNYINSLNK